MDLNQLRRKAEYLAHDAPPWVRVVCPRIESLNHILKTHRERLRAAGAVVAVGRENFIIIDPFEAELKAIFHLEGA